MTTPQEHDLFYVMIDGLKQAEDAAKRMARHQSDKPWDKIAENFKGMRERLYNLEMASSRSKLIIP